MDSQQNVELRDFMYKCANKGIFKYYKFITSWKRLKYSTHKQKTKLLLIGRSRGLETLLFSFYERKLYE